MRTDPTEFGTVSAFRTKLRATSSGHQGARKPMGRGPAATVLDEAFADYSNSATDGLMANDWRSVAQELIANITRQVQNLDIQRRQLARLLEDAENGTIG
ncbi:MAG TPA: hypothetical protein VHE81_18510 [Lacipirellulaceae bacterium]|nr:hypothetical protein [Lacipirellulaceae bacterium]